MLTGTKSVWAAVMALTACQTTPHPGPGRTPAAGVAQQQVKKETAPARDDCGLADYPVARSTQEVIADAARTKGPSPNSTMRARLAIDSTGRITHLRVLRLAYSGASGAGRINAQAVDAIKTWRYPPAVADGKPAATCRDVTVTVDLH